MLIHWAKNAQRYRTRTKAHGLKPPRFLLRTRAWSAYTLPQSVNVMCVIYLIKMDRWLGSFGSGCFVTRNTCSDKPHFVTSGSCLADLSLADRPPRFYLTFSLIGSSTILETCMKARGSLCRSLSNRRITFDGGVAAVKSETMRECCSLGINNFPSCNSAGNSTAGYSL